MIACSSDFRKPQNLGRFLCKSNGTDANWYKIRQKSKGFAISIIYLILSYLYAILQLGRLLHV